MVDIGVPRGAPSPERAGLVSERVLGLYPHRPRNGSKFDSGVVVVAGGSAGLTGAPTMVARSAQRAGAGYVQVAVPSSVQQVVELRLLEQMTRGLPDEDGGHTAAGADDLAELAERAGAVVLGPGLGRSEGAVAFARRVAAEVAAPLLVDADGLNAHAGALSGFAGRDAPTVLTPHSAELGRLLGLTPEEVDRHRLECARRAAEESGAVVLLKGDDTIVAAPGGPVAVSPGGSPALATAGTGDVLSGPHRRAPGQAARPLRGRLPRGARPRSRGPGGRRPARCRPRDGRRRDRRSAPGPGRSAARSAARSGA